MLPIVIALVVITVAVAGAFLAPRLVPRRIAFDEAPDRPSPFGSDMSWLAVRTLDTQALTAALELTDITAANWNSGLGAIYDLELADAYVFVSPPIKGWTIVAGVSLPFPGGSAFVDKTTPLLQRLSADFSEAQYFAAFPIIDFYGWARATKGAMIRAFAIGESGIVWNDGRLSPAERRLGLSLIELRGIRGRQGDIGGALHLHPTERHVLSLAAAWSINPMAMPMIGSDTGVGWIGRAPQSWRAERIRRVA